MTKFKILPAIWSVLVCVQSISAATYHVSTTGSDNNPGTQAQPWRKIQKAAEVAVAGDTVVVAPGSYNEIVTTVNSGAAGRPITFEGGKSATLTRFIIDKKYVVLSGFVLKGEDQNGSSAITLDDGAHYAVITNNVLDLEKKLSVNGISMSTDVFTDPSDTNAPRHCLIISNYIGNILGAPALQMGGRFNVFKLNTVTNIYTADFVRLFGHYNTLRNNRFLNNLYQEGVGYHPDFIQTFGENNQASLGHMIDGNIVSNIVVGQVCQLTMVNSFYDGQHGDWTFKNNIFVDIAMQASAGIPNVQWINNTFLRCNYEYGHVLALGYTEGRSNAEGAVVKNNVFLDCGRLDSNVSGWYSIGITNLVADYNFVAKNNYAPVREEFPRSTFRWHEPHGINGGNPRFMNENLLDMRLRSDSPLIDRGDDLSGVTLDFAGVPRPQGAGYDIGAFEYVKSSLQAPSTPTNVRIEAAQ